MCKRDQTSELSEAQMGIHTHRPRSFVFEPQTSISNTGPNMTSESMTRIKKTSIGLWK